MKLPSGEIKRTTMKQGQVEVTKIPKPTTSGAALGKPPKPDQKSDKKEVCAFLFMIFLLLIFIKKYPFYNVDILM